MKKTLLLTGALMLCMAALVSADVNVAAPFLQNGVGGRAKGMGDVYLATAEGPFGMFYNPAGLGNLEALSLGFQHDGIVNLMTQDVLAGSMPLGPGGIGLIFETIDYGTIEERDTSGNKLTESLHPRDSFLGAGYGMRFSQGLRAGAVLGAFSEDLGASKLSGALVSLGSAWDFNADGSLALAVKNLGSAPAGYALPRSLGLGGSYYWFTRRLLVSAEIEAPLSTNTFNTGLGAEFLAWKWLALRAGVKTPMNRTDLENVYAGLGINLWNFNLDMAVTGRGDLGTQGTLCLTYTFLKKTVADASEPEEEQTAKPDRTKKTGNLKYQGEDKNQAEFHFHAGKEYEKYGQIIDAIVEYKAALNIKPDYTEAQKALSAAREKARLQSQGQKDTEKETAGEANESLQQTIRKYYEQGLTAYKSKDYSAAIKQLQLVLELTTQHRQATELLEKAREALNSEMGVLRVQARRGRENGDLAQEIEACRKMLELDPENKNIKAELSVAEKKVPIAVDALYKKGVDQYAAGELRPALKTFQTLLQLQPDHVKAKDAEANIKEKLIKTGL